MLTLLHIVNVLTVILARLFWFSVSYLFLLGLFNETIKAYFHQKEEHYKRLESGDIGNKLLASRIMKDIQDKVN